MDAIDVFDKPPSACSATPDRVKTLLLRWLGKGQGYRNQPWVERVWTH